MVWRGAGCTQSLGILQNKEPLRYHVPKSEQGTCRRSGVTEVHRPGISVPISEPSHRASWAEYWHKWRRGPSLPLWWQPWIAIFYFFVWEHVWAVQLDLCASTCSVPGLPRAIPNISLAETAVPTDKFISSISKGHTDIHKHWIKPCTFIIPLVLVKSIGQDVFCLFLSKKTSSGSHLC